MSKRMIVTVVSIAVILAGVWGLTRYQRIRKTEKWIGQLANPAHSKAMEAMDLLSEQGVGVREKLRHVIESGAKQSQWRAAELLGELGKPQDADILVRLLKAEDPDSRAAAALALGKLGATEAIQPLQALVTNRKEALAVRCAACRALALLKATESTKALMGLLKEYGTAEDEASPDDKWELRAAAATALGSIGATDALKALGEAVNADKEPVVDVRTAAAYALGDLGTQTYDESNLQPVIDALVKAAKDECADVRAAAVYSLGRLEVPAGDTARVKEVLAAASSDAGYWVREAAQFAQKSVGR